MKKIITICFAFSIFMFSFPVKATIVMVEVEDFEFNPNLFNVNVGDTITWFWDEGFHTTTSTSIPAGAASWDSPISQTTPMFSYVVTVPGVYSFVCLPHQATGMIGQFTAVGTTAIEDVVTPSLSLMVNNLPGNEIEINYTVTKSGKINLAIFNLLGAEIKNLEAEFKSPGTYNKVYSVAELPKGIYLVNLIADNSIKARRIIIQ